MAKPIAEQELKAIEVVVSAHPEGIAIQDIQNELKEEIARRTLQYRLKHLVDEGRLAKEGDRRWAKYLLPAAAKRQAKAPKVSEEGLAGEVPLSEQAIKIQEYVRKPFRARKPVGYQRAFIDAYRPNDTAYLSAKEQTHLREVGTPTSGEQPAGTYAKQILNRLLIDLSWNSSRLEGNTYSLLDTKRLIDFGEVAEGKEQLEAQMILNHKDAIEFLVGCAEEIGFNRYTILNLHALLANNLLADPEATGRLRQIAVGIEKSAFHPLEVPQLIEECFDRILATAKAIQNPFEQAFFVMVQLPYLQAVRRREQARLAPCREHTLDQDEPHAALIHRRSGQDLHGSNARCVRTEPDRSAQGRFHLGLRAFRIALRGGQAITWRAEPIPPEASRSLA